MFEPVTVFIDGTDVAFGPLGTTDASPVKYQKMMGFCPSFVRKDLHKGFFGPEDVLLIHKSQPVGDPENMGIHSDPLLSEALSKDHVGGLSANAGKTHEFFPCPGNFTVKF